MYTVTCLTDDEELLLHHPADKELKLITPSLSIGMGESGGLSFSVPPGHPYADRILPLASEITVYDDDEIIFRGRRIDSNSDFYGLCKVQCEGDLSYLVDSVQRPFTFSGNPEEFLRFLLDAHNGQVEERKRFELGRVTIAGSQEGYEKTSAECVSTMDAVKLFLIQEYGGYLRVRHEDGKKYLDYLTDYGGINEQTIQFGENLMDLTKYLNPAAIITALVPYGATIDTDDGDADPVRVDIKTVNGGQDYIYDQAAVNTYGWIWGTITFDEVTEADALLAKARAYLDECLGMPTTIEATALDLSKAGVDIGGLRLGYWTQVESIPHKISQRMLITKKTIHLDDPGNDKVVLGQVLQTMTAGTARSQLRMSARVERVASEASKEIRRKVENATQLITGGTGGYVVLDIYDPDTGEKTHPWRLLFMDAPTKEAARNVIQINRNGIGFSTTGIDGPYRNAWTIDGNLVADFITVGTMLADRIRGGTLELGGTGLGKDGSIIVKDASGKQIGSWDKTGLNILRGILQGVSAIFGGVDNQNGAIEVQDASGKTIGRWDRSGLNIERGTLEIGPFYVDDDVVYFGDFYVSTDGSNQMMSGNRKIKITTADDGPAWERQALIQVGDSVLGEYVLQTKSAILEFITGETTLQNYETHNWWSGYTIFEALDWLYEEIESVSSGGE